MDLIYPANVSKIGGLCRSSTGVLLKFSYLDILECLFCDLFEKIWLESHGICSLGVIIYEYMILKLMTFVFGIMSGISDLLNFNEFCLRLGNVLLKYMEHFFNLWRYKVICHNVYIKPHVFYSKL